MSGPPSTLWSGAQPSRVPSGLPWPRSLWREGESTYLRLEPEGPLAPRASLDRGWARIEGLSPGPESPLACLNTLLDAGRHTPRQVAPRALLRIEGVNTAKALRAMGVKRVDRLLDRPLDLSLRLGPCYSLRASTLRTQGERVVCLARYQAQGWQALDIAQVARDLDQDLEALHGEGPQAHTAYLLAQLCVALDRAWLERDAAAREAIPALVQALRSPEPTHVQVSVQGPSWLDTSPWSGERCASQARATLHQLDGAWVGGEQVQVRTQPALRKGKRPAHREDRRVRRERLFSRWSQGVQVDDTGLLSATPEALALEMVAGLRGEVLDGTCGVGALAIAAARQGAKVHACDLNAARLKMAAHNAGLYGVRLSLHHCDVLELLAELRPDALILDPPWGGRDYDREGIRAQDLPFPLLRALVLAPERVRLKLPRSFVCESLPGQWRWRAAVDARGVLKFLVAQR